MNINDPLKRRRFLVTMTFEVLAGSHEEAAKTATAMQSFVIFDRKWGPDDGISPAVRPLDLVTGPER